jgi:glycyl-tRNA synthetase
MSQKSVAPEGAELMEKIVSLCKRKGFIFQSSEIYSGLNGAWDYGPLGVELKRNLKDYWWRVMTRERDDVVGMDGAILMNRKVWQASGHESTFTDPMVDCKETKARFRADQVYYSPIIIDNKLHGYVSVMEDDDMHAEAEAKAQKFKKKHGIKGNLEPLELKELTEAPKSEFGKIPSPATEKPGTLTEPRQFNLMFKTYVGATESEDAVTYLRPETAQSIFVQFKNVLETSRQKLPFGIAQIGKAFRNEINPRNYTFRSREFEQMELEYFCRPDDGMRLTDYWLEERLKFYQDIGLHKDKLHVLDVPDGERAHYSKRTYDIEYDFPFGRQELEGVAYRTDYDLSKHREHSGKPLEYFDDDTRERFVPHVVEPSAGCDRTTLALITTAYDEEEITDDKGKIDVRTVLRFHPRMAPIKAAIFPLIKKNEDLVRVAREIEKELRPFMKVFYDESGAIGRRYRRQDEVGTPFCVTVDFDTLGENDPENKDTVTLRERDSMEQRRVKISELKGLLLDAIL